MSFSTCITLQDIGKKYWLYTRYRDRLRQLILSSITHHDYARPFWALRDINLEVKQGEMLGIIGVNGSGKSTLLQIMAGTLQPTTGSISVHGRLSALLELGVGFHPEFTGRENVFLSGATLGIPEKEMKRRLDQILDFAGIGEFVDQPVKHYSSGMYVRLAFSIATCVDPEILIVDEALAVGDVGFVVKCMNRMRQLREMGTSIILVTHDVQTVRSLCDKVMWLSKGSCREYGSPMDVTSAYIQHLWHQPMDEKINEIGFTIENKTPANDDFVRLNGRPDLVRWGQGGIQIEGFQVESGSSGQQGIFHHGQPMRISAFITATVDIQSTELGIGICLRNLKGLDIITSTTYDSGFRFPKLHKGQSARIDFELMNILAPGDYSLVINAEDRSGMMPVYYDFIENATLIKVIADIPIFSMVLPDIQQTITLAD